MMSIHTTRRSFFYLVLSALVFVFACGEAGENGEYNEDNHDEMRTVEELEDEVCTHAQEDTPVPVSASLDIDDVDSQDDDIAQAHSHFVVELSENADGDYEGYVAFNVDEADEYGLFTSTSTDLPLSFYGPDKTELADQAQSHTFEACPEISAQHNIELDAENHFVRFGPTSDDTVEVNTITERVSNVE